MNAGYLAGFLDGEGTIGISITKSTAGYPIPALRVAFANFDRRPLDVIQKKYGGSISLQKTQVHALHINGEHAYNLLLDAYSHVIVKRDSAQAAIEFFQCHFVSPDQDPTAYLRKLHLALKVMEATRRGYKAERGTKMMDTIKEAMTHVESRLHPAPF
jgi:hypothetical protein